MSQLWQYLIKRPQIVAILALLGIVLLPIAVWLDLRHISDNSLRLQAENLNAMISEIRSYYATNVVGRVTASTRKSRPLHNYHDIPGAIPIPATLSIELGEVISSKGNSIGYRFVSDYVFSSRVPHDLDKFEKKAIATFRGKSQARKIVSEAAGSVFNRTTRVAVPVVMGGACVTCHNTHPESPKKDWKIGDVRGIQTVTVGQSIVANIKSFQFLIAYLAIAGTIGIAFSTLQWRQAITFHKLNEELATTNSFLASISMKISKYLPPQIYKSIFSGEKDVSISTERKKLTVFFSDIKDFTLASEHLQPEELTRLLNEYFSEMAAIANDYGATLDKFIGDAILAFFGDPETKGIKEDARACVRMALAMQHRLEELNQEWNKRGIERPFLARMGINTGYCNVGNFGSSDRMDYTIIGAEANLAARLESIADPSGIVMSYETYSHVMDIVEAKQLPPITLKGITREIVPYTVQNIFVRKFEKEPSNFTSQAPGITINIELDNLDDTQSRTAKATLESALRALKQRESKSN